MWFGFLKLGCMCWPVHFFRPSPPPVGAPKEGVTQISVARRRFGPGGGGQGCTHSGHQQPPPLTRWPAIGVILAPSQLTPPSACWGQHGPGQAARGLLKIAWVVRMGVRGSTHLLPSPRSPGGGGSNTSRPSTLPWPPGRHCECPPGLPFAPTPQPLSLPSVPQDCRSLWCRRTNHQTSRPTVAPRTGLSEILVCTRVRMVFFVFVVLGEFVVC